MVSWNNNFHPCTQLDGTFFMNALILQICFLKLSVSPDLLREDGECPVTGLPAGSYAECSRLALLNGSCQSCICEDVPEARTTWSIRYIAARRLIEFRCGAHSGRDGVTWHITHHDNHDDIPGPRHHTAFYTRRCPAGSWQSAASA
jgi:hypothetical protein